MKNLVNDDLDSSSISVSCNESDNESNKSDNNE